MKNDLAGAAGAGTEATVCSRRTVPIRPAGRAGGRRDALTAWAEANEAVVVGTLDVSALAAARIVRGYRAPASRPLGGGGGGGRG